MKSVLFKLSLAGVLLSATCTFATIDYYKKGVEFGKKVMQSHTQNASAASHDMDIEIVKLSTTLYHENASTEAHKVAFKNFKEYQRGVKETLASYTPTGKVDPENKMKDLFVKASSELADAVIAAPDFATVHTNAINISSKMLKELQAASPKLPVIQVTADPQHPLYKEGYAQGKVAGEWIALEAQGKVASAEEQVNYQKRVQKTLADAFKSGISQEDVMEGNFQYVSGMSQAIKEVNVESLIQKYKTPKEQADKIRTNYKIAIQSIEAGIQMTNPQKEMAALGTMMDEAAKQSNTNATNASTQQKTT